MSLLSARIAVIDTETSGLDTDPDARPIELAAVLLDVDGTQIAPFQSLMCPGNFDPEKAAGALAVNKIDPAAVLRAPRPAEVIADFRLWLEQHECTRLAAFNVKFDREMIRRVGFDDPVSWAPCIMIRAGTPMARAGQLLPRKDGFYMRVDGEDYRPPALWKAAQFFGVVPEGTAHRALTDATTAARILVALARGIL